MRQGFTAITSCVVLAWCSGCSPRQVVERTGDDVLVLELGGKHASLRAALMAMGREVEPSRMSPPLPVAPDVQEGDGREGDGRAAGPADTDVDRDGATAGDGARVDQAGQNVPVSPPASDWVTVPLPKGETLIHVAKRHLGDGRRFLELLAWNGWTEADARRLPAGQAIRVKRSELR